MNNKIIKIIESCKIQEHFDITRKYIFLAEKTKKISHEEANKFYDIILQKNMMYHTELFKYLIEK